MPNTYSGRFSRRQRKVLREMAKVLGMRYIEVAWEVRRSGIVWFLSHHRPQLISSA